jgi:acetylornithine/N-succinyldiaminopimelate aminotransferase
MEMRERESKYFFPTYKRIPVEISRGDGCYLVTKDGRRILDFFAGLAVNALGYGDRDVLRGIIYQTKNYLHLSNFYLQDAQVDLAETLLGVSGYDRLFLTNSGTETIEAAIKLARRWGKANRKSILVALAGSFHGRSMGSLSLTGRKKYREGYEPFLPGIRHCTLNDIDALHRAVDKETAAFFFEPIQGEGGVRPISREYIDALKELRERFGFLVVADEIQTGIGRTGTFFACEQLGVKPDMTIAAKALGGGLPLGALLVREELNAFFPPGSHGTTFGGNPVACAAGKVVVGKVSKATFLESVARKGERIREGVDDLRERYPEVIKEIRGMGLMLGIDLHIPGGPFVDRFLENNIFINCTDETVLRLLPPLVIGDREIDRFLEVFEKVLADR